ncbi:hypothetical protein FH972_010984 [Carpinus fangiana]|uniref:Uncharacterized protein n=1 Tax=Carpinus fangiana TaxID=176857 RepID=A0A660KW15_9ROSI|nr:hypothetical protein FH972_010984 [Carpinus fangiana]
METQREGKAVKERSCGFVEQVTLVTQKRQAVARDNDHREMLSSKVHGQAGSAPGSGVCGVALCGAAAKVCGEKASAVGQEGCIPASGVSGDGSRGGDGAVGVQGGANPKGRWVQVLLSPAPQTVEGTCQPSQSKVPLREEEVYDKGVSGINVKVELYNCREWLKRVRGELDAGLQRLNKIIGELDFIGPGQKCTGKEWVPKPKRNLEPRGGLAQISQRASRWALRQRQRCRAWPGVAGGPVWAICRRPESGGGSDSICRGSSGLACY